MRLGRCCLGSRLRFGRLMLSCRLRLLRLLLTLLRGELSLGLGLGLGTLGHVRLDALLLRLSLRLLLSLGLLGLDLLGLDLLVGLGLLLSLDLLLTLRRVPGAVGSLSLRALLLGLSLLLDLDLRLLLSLFQTLRFAACAVRGLSLSALLLSLSLCLELLLALSLGLLSAQLRFCLSLRLSAPGSFGLDALLLSLGLDLGLGFSLGLGALLLIAARGQHLLALRVGLRPLSIRLKLLLASLRGLDARPRRVGLKLNLPLLGDGSLSLLILLLLLILPVRLPAAVEIPAVVWLRPGALALLLLLHDRRGHDGGGLGGVGLTLRTFPAPVRLLLLRPLVMPAAPVLVALLFGGPLLAVGENLFATGLPVGGIGGLALLMHGSVVELASSGQIARGVVGFLGAVIRGRAAITVVDIDQLAAIVGVAVPWVLHQEGLSPAVAIEVVALAALGLFHDPVVAGLGTPNPRAGALVIDGVVRRAVSESVGHRIGIVNIAIALSRRPGGGPADRSRGRQLRGIRRDRLGRRKSLGQRQAGDRRAGCRPLVNRPPADRRGGLPVARRKHQARGGGGQEEMAVGHHSQTRN